MTRKTNARLAGSAFLVYIVVGISSLVLFGKATGGGEGTAAQLARLAEHATLVRVTVLLSLVIFMCAVVLAVTMYAFTRDEDRDLALLALVCRATEGVNAIGGAAATLKLLAIAMASTTITNAADAAATNALGASMLNQGAWTGSVTAMCFVIASAIYCYLFLRARTIPIWLSGLGVVASVLLLITIPLQIIGISLGPVTYVMWLPMLGFEVVFALWLIIKGVALPPNRQPAHA